MAELRKRLDGAPLNSEETGPDSSRADFVWCMTAITWGWTEETAERLMEESTKAQANGKAYAELTARNAALAVERRRQQPQHQRAAEDMSGVDRRQNPAVKVLQAHKPTRSHLNL